MFDFAMRMRISFLLNALLFALYGSVYAQFEDHFSDGNFTDNPEWTGTVSLFGVNTSGQLQTTGTVAGQAYLSTAFGEVSLDNKEWNFFIRQTFAGSDNNQSRVYLASSGDVLSYTGNGTSGNQGYFLKFGEGGSADAIRLFRDDGAGNPTELAACSAGAISASFTARVKITRNASGLWTLYADYTGESAFTQEASATDATYTTTSRFGVVCTYTASNADNFYFDDFYFGNIIVDTTPPELLGASAASSTSLTLQFSENLETASGQDPANYLLNGTISPTSASLSGAQVTLGFTNPFPPNTTQTIEVSNIADINGNILSGASAEFIFFVAATPYFRAVVFNEVLADPTPTVGLPDAEFVEIHNPTTESFNLENWSFVNSSTAKTLPGYTLAPGEYAILCDALNASFFSNAIGISSFTALTNAGDSLTLLDAAGQIIDILVYKDDWFETPEKLNGGWSLEQVNPLFPCFSAANWKESGNPDGGTPSAQNSVFNTAPDNTAPQVTAVTQQSENSLLIQFNETMLSESIDATSFSITPDPGAYTLLWNSDYSGIIVSFTSAFIVGTLYTIEISGPNDCSGNALAPVTLDFIIGFEPMPGDIIITEIMADPDPSYGAPTVEYIELYNRSENVLDISAVNINNGSFSSAVTIQPNSYLIVASSSNAAGLTGFSPVAFQTGFPGLSNSGATITLSHPENGIIDAVTYDISWYNDPEKDDGGYALEMINVSFPCSSSSNWTASIAAIGGTPGIQNSVFSDVPDNTPPAVVSIIRSAPSAVTIRFNEAMDPASVLAENITTEPSFGPYLIHWNPGNTELTVTGSATLDSGISYIIHISDVADCSGNSDDITYEFVIGFEPEPGEIIISEIMAAPLATSVYKAEYVEIFNRSGRILDLTQVSINSGVFTTQVILQPGEYIAVANVSNVSALSNVPGMAFMNGFPGLTNSGGTLTLLHPDAGALDMVAYSDAWYNDNEKDNGGWSLELINPNDPCSGPDNWSASGDPSGGTPGYRNSIFNDTPDTSAPQIVRVFSGNAFTATIQFNEPLDDDVLFNFQWIVNGETIIPSTISFVEGSAGTALNLSISGAQPGIIYTFTLLNIKDCWGNETHTLTGFYAVASPPEPGDMVINEVLSNPFEGGSDFVELYNNSQKVISLSNWNIAAENNGIVGTPQPIGELGVIMLPGDYIVLTEDGNDLPRFYPFTRKENIWKIADLPSYNNESGVVVVLFPDGSIADRFAYTAEHHFVLLDDRDGVSLERIDPSRNSDDPTNWSSAAESQGFATPGYQNSQALAALLGEEDISIYPEIFSPDNDGYNDVVTFTFQNVSPGMTGNVYIFDSNGRPVIHLMKNELLGVNNAISWDGRTSDQLLAPLGIYIVYFEVFDENGNTSKLKKTCVLAHALD